MTPTANHAAIVVVLCDWLRPCLACNQQHTTNLQMSRIMTLKATSEMPNALRTKDQHQRRAVCKLNLHRCYLTLIRCAEKNTTSSHEQIMERPYPSALRNTCQEIIQLNHGTEHHTTEWWSDLLFSNSLEKITNLETFEHDSTALPAAFLAQNPWHVFTVTSSRLPNVLRFTLSKQPRAGPSHSTTESTVENLQEICRKVTEKHVSSFFQKQNQHDTKKIKGAAVQLWCLLGKYLKVLRTRIVLWAYDHGGICWVMWCSLAVNL